jgi:1-acyl-sn-glycerol-3-phosphate acyltransferase
LLIRFVKFYVDFQLRKHAKLNVNGLENLSDVYPRPYLFVCNHLSNSDGLILNKVLEKEKIIFVAGKKLKANSLTDLGLKIVRNISILPNSPDKEAIKQVVAAVKAGNSIFVFPEGTRSRSAKMIEAKRGILLFAKLTKAPIVPVGMWGTEKFMPINADMGKEGFHDAEININIGEVFELPEKADGETKESWDDACLNRIMTSIARLLPKEYRGYYDE